LRGKHDSLAFPQLAAIVVIEPVSICRPEWYNGRKSSGPEPGDDDEIAC
jgi:hypothetical protein